MVWWVGATIIYVILILITPLLIKTEPNSGFIDFGGLFDFIGVVFFWGVETIAYLGFWIVYLAMT